MSGERTTLCLNMIVKDEAHIIVNTLKHLTDLFTLDYWVISDTGSTDGTQDLIRKFFQEKQIPGDLHEDPWKNFGHNRSLALKHAYNKTEYVLVWDADDYCVGKITLPETLTGDVYNLVFGTDNGFRYIRRQLFNNHKRWKYVGVLHEYPDCEEPIRESGTLRGDYYLVSGRSGNRNKDPKKYEKDATILEQGILDEPNNTRYVFYCANSYNHAGMYDQAIEKYKRVLEINGWAEEKYVSCIELYEIYETQKKTPEVGIQWLINAQKYNPFRIECVYRLVKYYCGKGDDETALKYYSTIAIYYENVYLKDDVSRFLFSRKQEYDFYLPYHMTISALRLKKYDLAIKMYSMIFQAKYLHVSGWHVGCLFANMQFLKDNVPLQDLSFLEGMLEYKTQLQNKGISFKSEVHAIVGNIVEQYRATLGDSLSKSSPIIQSLLRNTIRSKQQNEKIGVSIRVMFSITTCKRMDLFTKTMNSILRTWKDLDVIDYFLCVDDNSSEEDRRQMRSAYPFFDYYMKSVEEKGHRQSMNIIWNKLQQYKPHYWIHMEDDWLFFKADNYVQRSIDFLEKYNAKNIHQILFNRNYAETYDWEIQGGEKIEPGYIVHQKSDTIQGKNCGYWPHYSFRPSMVRAQKILELGNFDSPNTFFERDYADRYYGKEYKSAFYDTIVCRHIGKLTHERNGTNAYTLNKEDQFGSKNQTVTSSPCKADQSFLREMAVTSLPGKADQFGSSGGKKLNTFVVNLKRRPDRRETMKKLFQEAGIKQYEFYEAVDGRNIQVTDEIVELFQGNDFGNRCGVIGCALSHYRLWQRLVTDPHNDYYVVFEDDITLCENFSERLEEQKKNIDPSTDVLFLGYTTKTDKSTFVEDNKYVARALDMSNYIGGTFGYIVTKQGATKYLNFIREKGIKHGIDYITKLIPEFQCKYIQPHMVLTDWVQTIDSTVDSDIQKDRHAIQLVKKEHKQIIQGDKLNMCDWVFFGGLDSYGGDIGYIGKQSVEKMMDAASHNPSCVAFNTMGYLKHSVRFPLQPSEYVRAPEGLYVLRSHIPSTEYMSAGILIPTQPKKNYRVKLLCNWSSSKELLPYMNKMTKGNFMWDNITITWEDTDIDYYVILNKPFPGEKYAPARTIVLQLEPWCSDPTQNWGVKTWGEWARPDPAKFLHVHSHEKYCNPASWQFNISYSDLLNKPIEKSSEMANIISSICSSKYFDPGHKLRIDFLKFMETKNDPAVQLHIYNHDNDHQFRSYVGKALPDVDKEKGLLPYKYYFMCENNAERNFITEKLWEPILTDTLCFYWGCPNVQDFVDPRAFVQLDMNDFEGSFQTVKSAIQNNLWQQRLPFIREEKKKILNSLNIISVMHRNVQTGVIRSIFPTPVKQRICVIHSCHLKETGTDALDLLMMSAKTYKLFDDIDHLIISNVGLPLDAERYTFFSRKVHIIQQSSDPSVFELPTLRFIQQYSSAYPESHVLYLHTKGISYQKSANKSLRNNSQDWILYMLAFLVEKKEHCYKLLESFDTVGCNYQPSKPHYSGNFWWARASYLKDLPDHVLTDKLSAEFWLFRNHPNYCALHHSQVNHFEQPYPRESYEDALRIM